MLLKLKLALSSGMFFKRVVENGLYEINYRLPVAVRQKVHAGEQHYCPICENHVRQFLVLRRPHHLWCPICASLSRHRTAWYLFQKRSLQVNPGSAFKFLHVAPEACLEKRFRALPNVDYTSADLYNRRAMLKIDIMNTAIPDASFDMIYCSHVLEHVADDRRALQEFHRVLKPGGRVLLQVPIHEKITQENATITNPMDRERLYGQYDHVRSYGSDILERLKEARFQVTCLNANDVASAEEIYRMGLSEEVLFVCDRL